MVKLDQNVYKKLARRLNVFPYGFPKTESGVELKLLVKIFTPEEAALASEMRLTHESAEQIARRTGRDPIETTALLEAMVQKGQIEAINEGEQRRFCLMPYLPGFYDEQLGRMDEELARLYEEYYPAFAKELLGKSPPYYKVIPVEKSIPVDACMLTIETDCPCSLVNVEKRVDIVFLESFSDSLSFGNTLLPFLLESNIMINEKAT